MGNAARFPGVPVPSIVGALGTGGGRRRVFLSTAGHAAVCLIEAAPPSVKLENPHTDQGRTRSRNSCNYCCFRCSSGLERMARLLPAVRVGREEPWDKDRGVKGRTDVKPRGEGERKRDCWVWFCVPTLLISRWVGDHKCMRTGRIWFPLIREIPWNY